MSKRKTRAKSLTVDKADLVFEDDSDPEIALKIINQSRRVDEKKPENNDANGSVRSSSRAKKQKNIYDPSEFNGPVHKKKKEAMETILLAESKKKQVPKPLTKSPKLPIYSSKSTPNFKSDKEVVKKENVNEKNAKIAPVVAPRTPKKISKPPLHSPVITENTNDITSSSFSSVDEYNGLSHKKKKDTVLLTETNKKQRPTTPKKTKSDTGLAAPVPKASKPAPPLSTTIDTASSSVNSEFEGQKTVVLDDKKVPDDVSKWTSSDVFNYFSNHGFDKKDALILKKQEIDGEALLILRRDDLKDIGLKIGTYLKMWNRILTFQSGSLDFTQGWK